jgi:hypothetical protein
VSAGPYSAHVYAGSINQSGALEIRTDRIGRDTTNGKKTCYPKTSWRGSER